MTVKGNIGEWSEIYTLFKILGDKTLYAGDEYLEKVRDVMYPVIRVLRTESNGSFEYSIDDDIVLITSRDELLLRLKVSEFAKQAQKVFDNIKNKPKSSAFEMLEIEEFMKKVHCSSLKASSSQKTDITIKIHDSKTNQQPILGFSIKSQLGSPSTLLNAGKTTNFTYRINGLNAIQIKDINSIDGKKKIINRVNKIIELGGEFVFERVDKQEFSNNLILIDSSLPLILSNMLVNFYVSNHSTIKDLVEDIEVSNPLVFDSSLGHKFYTYKIKKMLTDIALGLMPSKVWSGTYDATGGYLVVKKNGQILCYHIYNRNDFENYLFFNTKLETASTSKYDFGELYEENGNIYFKLNLQIRFSK